MFWLRTVGWLIGSTVFASSMNSEIITHAFLPLARVRPGAPVTINFIRDDQPVCTSAHQLLNADSLGATVRLNEDDGRLLTNSLFDAELTIGNQTVKFSNAVATIVCEEDNSHLVHIAWEPSHNKSRVQQDRPPRWQCDKYLAPICVIDNPYELYGKKCFKVENLSRLGMGLITSQPLGLLVPGMRLQGALQFPGLGQETVTLELRWISPGSEGAEQEFCLGAKIIEAAPSYYACVGQYLFQYINEIGATEIRRAGLLVPSVSSGITYEFAQSSEDYREVLRLREETYRWSQLSPVALKLGEMGDAHDARANILIARHQGKCVGCLRIIFPGSNDVLEQAKHVTIPDSFPSKTDIAEVTRICIDLHYRKGDLILGLMKQTLLTVLQNNRSWIVGCSEDQLLPYYQSLGAKLTDLKYQRKDGSITLDLTIILLNVVDYLNQVNVSQPSWNLLAPDVIAFANRNNLSFNNRPTADIDLG